MQNVIVCVFGRKGTGKTTYAANLTEKLYQSGKTVIVVAPMGGFKLHGSPEVDSVKQLEAVARSGRRSMLIIPDMDDDLPTKTFEFAYRAGNCVLVVDEVDTYFSHANPDPWLRKIVRYGRHRGVSLIAICQRPANVQRDLTAMADELILFSMTENRDIEYLKARIGVQGVAQVTALPPFKHYRWNGSQKPVDLFNQPE